MPPEERLAQWLGNDLTVLRAEGKGATIEAWLLQTWANLRRAGVAAELATDFPTNGLVIALASTLPPAFQAPPKAFLLGVVADGLPHPAAHLHILQNPAHARRLPNAVFMPHWPHPALRPRKPARSVRWEHLDFFGDPRNLAAELKDAAIPEQISAQTGLMLRMRPAEEWGDYSETDAVVAIRDFQRRAHLSKPPTKLLNAWLAGVPFLGGWESAHVRLGRPGVDCLLCPSLQSLFAHLQLLTKRPNLREQLATAGQIRSREFNREAILKRWQNLLLESAPVTAKRWERLPAAVRTWATLTQRLALVLDRIFLH